MYVAHDFYIAYPYLHESPEQGVPGLDGVAVNPKFDDIVLPYSHYAGAACKLLD